jgi:hypothetical protein
LLPTIAISVGVVAWLMFSAYVILDGLFPVVSKGAIQPVTLMIM